MSSTTDSKDSKKQMADIYVFTRHIEDLQADSRSFQHWILVAKFPHKTLYLDANNLGGHLVPSISYSEPDNIKSRKYIDSIKTSVDELIKLSQDNIFNYQMYSALVVNCQIWVNEMLKKIGLSRKTTVTEKLAVLGVVPTMMFGIPGAIAYSSALFVANAFASGSINSSQK